MVNFDYFGGLKSALKFYTFTVYTCEESVRIRLICKELVRFFSDVKNWYPNYTHVENRINPRTYKEQTPETAFVISYHICKILLAGPTAFALAMAYTEC